jgi:hypothetical protein
MTTEATTDRRDEVAIFRYGLIADLTHMEPGAPGTYARLQEYRCTGVTRALLSGLRDESERRGITHWVAGANMETDFAEDAALAYRVAHDKDLISRHFHAVARAAHPARMARTRPGYTDEQRLRAQGGDRAGLELPRVLSLFSRWMGARFIGAPVYDAYFNVFALRRDLGCTGATRTCSDEQWWISRHRRRWITFNPPPKGDALDL